MDSSFPCLNKSIEAMSSVVTDAIVSDVGTHWFTIKVNRTCDLTGRENISILNWFISEDNKEVTEHLLTMATAEAGDADTLTGTLLQECVVMVLPSCLEGGMGPKTTTRQTWPRYSLYSLFQRPTSPCGCPCSVRR